MKWLYLIGFIVASANYRRSALHLFCMKFEFSLVLEMPAKFDTMYWNQSPAMSMKTRPTQYHCKDTDFVVYIHWK